MTHTQDEIVYLTDVEKDAKVIKSPVQRTGKFGLLPGQGADGYGNRITTDYAVKIGRYTLRVYAICHSNVASHYVVFKGQKMFLHDYDFNGAK